jgi:hypothetical protein
MTTLLSSIHPLLPGETPLPKAPLVVLDDGTNCIPQHYLSYDHSKQSVAAIIAEIDFDPRYVLFVDEERKGIFIQVGIIGKDNYQAFDTQQAEKIVYGRRWRVEPQLPSSEIIQTAFLALSKAREHEIRELFKYKFFTESLSAKSLDSNNTTKHTQNCDIQAKNRIPSITTPFSCHHDLPLISMSNATNASSLRKTLNIVEMQACCRSIRYDHAQFVLLDAKPLDDGQYLLTLQINVDKRTQLPELLELANNRHAKSTTHILVKNGTKDGLKHGLMDFALQLNNRFAEENFTFKGFARFSRLQSIEKISSLSTKTRTRNNDKQDVDFANTYANANYETDSSRVPRISAGPLGKKIKQQLNQFNIKYGILPKNEA